MRYQLELVITELKIQRVVEKLKIYAKLHKVGRKYISSFKPFKNSSKAVLWELSKI